MPVDTQHPEYVKATRKMWPTMRDVIEGEDAVKEKNVAYLPPPGTDDATSKRYLDYLLRAVFVRYTGRTTKGLNGAIYRKAPSIELPSQLDYMKDNADGSGQGLEQISKQITQEQADIGRVGILLDRPPKIPGNTREDDLNNKLRANLSIYKTESIINWKTKVFGGVTVLTMVVLVESIEIKKDEFESESKVQYRVLGLDDAGFYYQQLYNDKKEPEPATYPTDLSGAKWDYIPFKFVGSEDNTDSVDEPPFYGMAKVNLALYRNSADYEEGIHMFGQPTPWVDVGEASTSQWKEANQSGITVGSRNGIIVGKGGKFALEYMQANTAAKEAMDQKQEQMVAIGAKVVRAAGQNQTAEEARINASAEHSVLDIIAGNADDAINDLLRSATKFEGGNPDGVEFKLNREFFPQVITAQDATALAAMELNGLIAKSDARNLLRKTDWIDPGRTDEEIDAEVHSSGFGLNGGNE